VKIDHRELERDLARNPADYDDDKVQTRTCHLANQYGHVFGKVVLAPECGSDFCDSCGDCLGCSQADGPCLVDEDGNHFWVHYSDDVEALKKWLEEREVDEAHREKLVATWSDFDPLKQAEKEEKNNE